MSLNLIDLIKGQLGAALVSQVATRVGESESAVAKAMGGFLPAVLGGFANKAQDEQVLDVVENRDAVELLSNLLNGTQDNALINQASGSIFGDKTEALIQAVSSFSKVGNEASKNILNIVMGAVLGSLGKYTKDHQLDRNGISALLQEQKGFLASVMPEGLVLGNTVNEPTAGIDADRIKVTSVDAPQKEAESLMSQSVNQKEEGMGGMFLKWLVPLILLLAAGYFLFQQYNTEQNPVEMAMKDSISISPEADTLALTKNIKEIDLNGNKIQGYEMESQVIDFLKSDAYTKATDDEALKNTWFTFDNVNFKMASSTELEAGSESQIQNLATILKAYPEAKIKIGGYTDKTGDAAANKKLSHERANFIKSELTRMGVGAQVVGAEGYGSEFATVPAEASNAERAKDRKMAVRFVK